MSRPGSSPVAAVAAELRRGLRRIPRPTPLQVAQAIGGLALAAILLIWGLPWLTQTSWHRILGVLQHVGGGTATELLVLMLVGLGSYTFTLSGSLPGLSHRNALIVNLGGSAVGNLLPGGGAIGVAATYLMCRSWGFTRRAISTSIIVSGVWNVLARLALPVVGLVVLLVDPVALPASVVRGGVIGALLGLLLLGGFIAVLVSRRAARRVGHGVDAVLHPLFRRFSRGREISLDTLIVDMRVRVREVVRTGWFPMTFGLAGFFAVYYVLFWRCLDAVGVDLTFPRLFAAYAVGRLLTTIGITPGGIGVSEAGTALVLIRFGADPSHATAGVVLFSLYSHVLEIPFGALCWLAWGATRKRTPPDAEPTLSDAAA